MKPVITIIIPVYNSEKWISRCLESVINQTYSSLDIIIINDGSTDNSGSICDEYSQLDSRIRVIHKKNEGPSVARNIGIDLANGDYIQFVDSDDWLIINACETLIENLTSEDVDQVMCGLNITHDGKLLRTPHLPRKKYSIYQNANDFFELFKIFASPCNKLYKKELIKTIFDTERSMGEDLSFNLNYLKETDNILTIEECLYNVSLDNSESLNRKFRIDRLDKFLETQKEIFHFCSDIYMENYDKTFLFNKSVLGVHSYYRDICKIKDKKTAVNIIKRYLNEMTIKEAVNKANHDRLDYKIFNVLMKLKKPNLIYFFFRLKIVISK